MTAVDEPDYLTDERTAWLDALAKGRTAAHGDQPAGLADTTLARLVPGGLFVLDAPDTVPAVWGLDDQVLWAAGESLEIVGPAGVGKTTLAGQLVAGRLGLGGEVLGYPVIPGQRCVLYLASDRPRQVQRALRRLFSDRDRDLLDERLIVWPGPPPADVAKHPEILLLMAQAVGADTIVLDSLKDMAVGLADDEVGAGLNRAIQRVLVEGVEVLALHHQRKGSHGDKPRALADVYGSTWITAGAGSVVLLWGEPGDLIVDLKHLKQPAAEVGPLKVEHDHDAGRSSVARGFELLRFLRKQPKGVTATQVAKAWFEKDAPNDNERKKAERALKGLVGKGLAHAGDPGRDDLGQRTGTRYFATTDTLEQQ